MVADVGGCRLYKIEADHRVFYMASNTGNYGSCALLLDHVP
jgi:hypothetical protein